MSEVDPHIQAILVESYGEHSSEQTMERRHELIKRHIFERSMHETNPVISRPVEEINQDLK